MLQGLMTGIKKYQAHPYTRTLPELPAVWQAGQARLLYAKAGGKRADGAPPLVLIPSMINGYEILDLLRERSFARWMAAQGRDVYVLDWGASTLDDGQRSFDALITERLIPALQWAAAENGGSVDVLGYCMGGTLAVAAIQAAPLTTRRAVFLAAPWDFHAGDKKLQQMVSGGAAAGMALITQQGVLPSSWVQGVFASVDPLQAVRKFTSFAAMADDEPRAWRFVAAEDWLNAAADLPRDVAQGCIQIWYLDNAPGRGAWRVSGQAVDPAALSLPSLIVVAGRDQLVPPESSAALRDAIKGAAWVEAPTGHIGLIAGEQAVENVWQPIDAWLRAPA